MSSLRSLASSSLLSLLRHGRCRVGAAPLGVLRRGLSGSSAVASSPPSSPLSVFSDEEQAMRDTARKFAQEVIAPRVRAMDAAGVMDASIIRRLFEMGLMGVEIPEEHGGTGSSFTAACLVVEELARVDASVAVLVDVQNTLVNNIFAMYASPEIRARALPRLATDTVGCFCLSEAGSGSDAFALKTRADKTNDYYTISGAHRTHTYMHA